MAENGTAPAAGPSLAAHDGPWTEDAYLALDGGLGGASTAGGQGGASTAGGQGGASTAGGQGGAPSAGRRRIELVDGSLLVAPTTDDRHARAVASVRAAVAAALPDGLEVTGPVALRLSPGRILVPDLVVAARSGDDVSDAVRDSAAALLVIDVVGRGNGVADRWFKPQLYAGSRIPYALLVDHDEPFAVGNMLIGGRYHSYAQAGAGEVLRLEEPFDLELALDDLVEPKPADAPPQPAANTDQPTPA